MRLREKGGMVEKMADAVSQNMVLSRRRGVVASGVMDSKYSVGQSTNRSSLSLCLYLCSRLAVLSRLQDDSTLAASS